METRVKLRILADAAKYDASCASSGSRRAAVAGGIGNSDGTGICHSYTPDGRCVSLLKILLTNYCVYDCQYCVNRVTSDTPRARFSVDEVVRLTLAFYRRNYIEGLFLSSGVIRTPDETMAELAAVARTLRVDHRFGGYIHLKAVPGASDAALLEAGRFADRLSANVELPREEDLRRLAPEKTLADVETTMSTLREKIDEAKADAPRRARSAGSTGAPPSPATFCPAGQSTQMIVGATDATDRDILGTASSLYRRHRLRRVYYSAFSPIPHGSGLLPCKSPPLIREHRLYQADWLLRFYGFRVDEITDTAAAGNLELDIDPKLAWALRHRELFPLDVNRAPREMLLRIPGVGVRTVQRILAARRWRRLTLADLRQLHVPLRKASPFLLTADRNPAAHTIDSLRLRTRVATPRAQLELFAAASSAGSGEV